MYKKYNKLNQDKVYKISILLIKHIYSNAPNCDCQIHVNICVAFIEQKQHNSPYYKFNYNILSILLFILRNKFKCIIEYLFIN